MEGRKGATGGKLSYLEAGFLVFIEAGPVWNLAQIGTGWLLFHVEHSLFGGLILKIVPRGTGGVSQIILSHILLDLRSARCKHPLSYSQEEALYGPISQARGDRHEFALSFRQTCVARLQVLYLR